jgi:hypothetical protein
MPAAIRSSNARCKCCCSSSARNGADDAAAQDGDAMTTIHANPLDRRTPACVVLAFALVVDRGEVRATNPYTSIAFLSSTVSGPSCR